MTERIERQELHCHACNQYVQFRLDVSMNGNHVVNCPNCGHEHCRVVKDGIITDIRWSQRNGPTYFSVGAVTTSTVQMFTVTSIANATAATGIIYGSWLNSYYQ